MNTRKSIAVVAAMLITAAGMAGIANYSNAAATAVRDATHNAATVPVTTTTLPVTTVRPSAEQLRELRNARKVEAGSGTTSASANDMRMPFYSFATDAAST